MNRDALTKLSTGDLIALVEALTAQVEALSVQNAALARRVAELEAKLDLPPKTPDNSSTPPSQGRKANETAGAKPKSKPHSGAHRPLHPSPTRKMDIRAQTCSHYRAYVSEVKQTAVQAYRVSQKYTAMSRIRRNRPTSPIAAMKASATIRPTPGTLISRQHTSERRASSRSRHQNSAIQGMLVQC